jgi:hypothetical protein
LCAPGLWLLNQLDDPVPGCSKETVFQEVRAACSPPHSFVPGSGEGGGVSNKLKIVATNGRVVGCTSAPYLEQRRQHTGRTLLSFQQLGLGFRLEFELGLRLRLGLVPLHQLYHIEYKKRQRTYLLLKSDIPSTVPV